MNLYIYFVVGLQVFLLDSNVCISSTNIIINIISELQVFTCKNTRLYFLRIIKVKLCEMKTFQKSQS